MAKLSELFDRLWQDYQSLCPQSHRIHALLSSRGDTVVNDHIALRTFDDPRVGLDALAGAFRDLGYREADTYRFEEKKLLARHYEHPDPAQPLVFISELMTEAFPKELGKLVRSLVDQLPPGIADRPDFPVCGRLWEISSGDYQKLASLSEYAGWVAAFGFRANHFTVSVNHLQSFDSLAALNSFLKAHGFALNSAGGEIKGSPTDLLEQSSTLADKVKVTFTDAVMEIPGCYYEFARRYPGPDGKLFRGFVAKSADKIFQSTDRR